MKHLAYAGTLALIFYTGQSYCSHYPDHEDVIPFCEVGLAAVIAALMVGYLIVPEMGTDTRKDILRILVAFPLIGGLTGLIAFQAGLIDSAYAALSLAMHEPWPIIPVYGVIGALVFWLPRVTAEQ